MREFVNKLKYQQKGVVSGLPTAIFGAGPDLGSALDLGRPRFRIGLWPFQSTTTPEVAMGIAAILGLLLERESDVIVYRLFAQIYGEPGQHTWTLDQSQFGVDDWQLEGLDENVAIWGTLERVEPVWTLTIDIENDQADSEADSQSLSFEVASIEHLLEALPRAVEQIFDSLNVTRTTSEVSPYTFESKDGANYSEILTLLFRWELHLYLLAWGKDWPVEEILSNLEALLTRAREVGDEFAAWAISTSIARAMLPVFDPVGEVVSSTISDVVASFPNSAVPANLLGRALFRARKTQEAFDLLEANVASHPESVGSRVALADICRQAGRITEALDTFHSAIEENVTSPILFMRYAELLLILDYQGWAVEDFILIDPNQKQTNHLIWEATEAFEAALQLDPLHLDALYSLVSRLVDLEDGRLWPRFKRLVELDKTGDKVRSILDAMYHIEDISPAIQALRDAIKLESGRCDLHVNLAVAYLVMEQGDRAELSLERARGLTEDPSVKADIDRLMLSAEDPDFEERLGELTDLISAGSPPGVEDVDFLEDSVARVPTFAEGYLLLAKAYLLWEEPDAVLETLLDAQKNLPDDPDVLELLARTLWNSGEEKLAFDYLNQGLLKNPNHVPLLALTGRYLYENRQDDAAKTFLARAEAIAPRHPALNEARVHIAKRVD